MNTTIKFFATKDQYLAFRAAFAAAQNSPRAKKGKADENGRKEPGWLQSEHYLFLSLVMGRDFYVGFSPKTQKAYLKSGGNSSIALGNAITRLGWVIASAKKLMDPTKFNQAPSWVTSKAEYVARQTQQAQNLINAFLEPFAGTITLADLTRIEVPSFNGLTTEQHEAFCGKSVTYADILKVTA